MISPAQSTNRILIDITPHHRIAIPMPVLIQPRLPVMVLPWQPEGLVHLLRIVFLNCYFLFDGFFSRNNLFISTLSFHFFASEFAFFLFPLS